MDFTNYECADTVNLSYRFLVASSRAIVIIRIGCVCVA